MNTEASNMEALIYVVDDDTALAKSVGALVSSLGWRSRTYGSADDFLRSFDLRQPGCIVLDVRMPGTSGLTLLEQLAKMPLAPTVVMMTGFAEVATAVRAMRHGATDFLQKTCKESELCDAIRRAVARDAENRLAFVRREKLLDRTQRLKPAERAVLELLLAGKANKNIAAELGVSERTVEDRRARVMQKFEVDSLPKLVMTAIEAGLHPAY
jgi:FixJ family two-component response regulator